MDTFNAIDNGICVSVSNNKDGELSNPFFMKLGTRARDYALIKEETHPFKHIWLLCIKQSSVNNPILKKLYQPILKYDELSEIGDHISLIKASKRLLYSNVLGRRYVIVECNILSQFNKSIGFDPVEIVLPIFELADNMANLYVSLYDGTSNLKEIFDLAGLVNYYNFGNKNGDKLSQALINSKESDYWTLPHNCEVSFSSQFTSRSFQWKEFMSYRNKYIALANVLVDNSENKDLTKIVSKFAKSQKSVGTNFNQKSYNLPTNEKGKFIDVASALKTQERRTYYATIDNGNLPLTREMVTDMFSNLSRERDMYDVFNTLLVSKDYCHMVLNNKTVLTRMQPLFKKFMPLYKYLFGYAWNAFYIEECLWKTRATCNSRYIFDINTANLLPVFPFCDEDIYQNPYVTLLIDNKLANPQNNCMSLSMFADFPNYGIDTLDRFRWKFNVFSTGDPYCNIFDGLEWGDKYAVSGSMIPAFLVRSSPLFDLVVDKTCSEVQQWTTYFNQYYSDSDIDFMCNDASVFGFIDSIYNVQKVVEKNIGDQLNVEPIKTSGIVIHGQYIMEKLDDIRIFTCKPDLTVEQVINGLDDNSIKEYFYGLYLEHKKNSNAKHRQYVLDNGLENPLYEMYYRISSIDELRFNITSQDIEKDIMTCKDSENYTYLNDLRSDDKKVPTNKNILVLKIGECVKFKLHSSKMLHSIETFRVASFDFFSTVARFHLPCVRGYYNGDNVYVTPSCITSNMTGINVDYKYFAGVRDPIEILNKYRSRGYGTILTSSEKAHMIKYNEKLGGKLYNVDPVNPDAYFGFKQVDNDLFKIGHFNKGYPIDAYNVLQYQQIKTLDDLKRYYKALCNYDVVNCGIDMFKFKAINKSGNIMPLQKWIMDACWNLMNHDQ